MHWPALSTIWWLMKLNAMFLINYFLSSSYLSHHSLSLAYTNRFCVGTQQSWVPHYYHTSTTLGMHWPALSTIWWLMKLNFIREQKCLNSFTPFRSSHSMFIHFRPKYIHLERLISTELALLQSSMTYMYEKCGSQYHWWMSCSDNWSYPCLMVFMLNWREVTKMHIYFQKLTNISRGEWR